MQTTKITIAGKDCRIYADNAPTCILIQPTGEHELEYLDEEVSLIRQHVESPIAFVSFRITDWNKELSPWKARQAFGDDCFGDGAKATLQYIIEKLILELHKHMEISETTKYILGGYSLAGLFSLWSTYQTDIFDGAAACSPSIWIDGWKEYATCHKPLTPHIYLSLGTKEHKTRNSLLRTIKADIMEQSEQLQRCGTDTALEWNPGNHFQENTERMTKGFLWCIKHISMQNESYGNSH